MNPIKATQFADLFLQDTHFIDVRAPIEFQQGSIPGAVNLPLLTDNERHEIGIAYKNLGQAAAIEMGHKFVSGEVREARLQLWINEIKKHPDAVIFCFRGGLRSQIVQSWLKEAGVDRPIIDGGYKALRRYLMSTIEEKVHDLKFEVVSGPTGSGKTTFINSCGRPFLDLEQLAQHRGSAFGGTTTPQPTQIDFENALAVKLIRLAHVREPILIENESHLIGSRYIPDALFMKMKASPRLLHKVSLDERVENIFREYVVQTRLSTHADLQKFMEFRQAVKAISKRLGGERAQEIHNDLDFSQNEFETTGRLDSCRVWIRKLLSWYYDPLYERAYSRVEE